MDKREFLTDEIRHIDIRRFDARPIIDAYADMAYQARNLANAAGILNRMLADRDCAVFL